MPEVKSLTYIEIDVPYCGLTYGVLPCLANAAAGTAPCYNTVKTCQSRSTFSNAPQTLRFTFDVSYLDPAIPAIPSLQAVNFNPGTISLGEDLGIRSSLNITFKDHPSPDTGAGFDKYLSQRTYDPFKQGSFWGKFRARQPYVYGINVRLIRGYLGQPLSAMETRNFVGDSFSGPDANGVYTLVAKDVLRFATGDVSQAPVANQGYLSANMTNVDSSATLIPAGIGDANYNTSGYIVIGGNEICTFTRLGDVITLTARGLLGTAAQAHNINDTVQQGLYYLGLDPTAILYDLLVNYAKVPANYIPLSDWQTETATYLNQVYTGFIPTPTNVDTLVTELIKQGALSLWWDDISKQIKLQVLRGIATNANVLDESKIIAGSMKVTEQPDTRMTECWVNFGMRDRTLPLTQLNNYTSVAVQANLQAELDYGTPVIDTVNCRWIAIGGRTIAQNLGLTRLNRYLTPPRKFSFDIFRWAEPISLGAGYNLRWWNLQNADGSRATVPIQVTRINPMADRLQIEAQENTFASSGSGVASNANNHVITIDTSNTNLNLKTIHDALYAPAVAGNNVICYINAGVKVGSTSTATPAFDIGVGWAAGVNITLNIAATGKIEGAGGNGGKGAAKNPPPNGTDGAPGGTALYTRTAITLANFGSIYGGGGGGGGGGANSTFAGGGGGGGAGYTQNGIGGSAGGGDATAHDGQRGTETSGGTGGASGAGNGGDGGNPGSNGHNGAAPSASAGHGGNAGNAIDGVSNVTGASGDILGPQVN